MSFGPAPITLLDLAACQAQDLARGARNRAQEAQVHSGRFAKLMACRSGR